MILRHKHKKESLFVPRRDMDGTLMDESRAESLGYIIEQGMTYTGGFMFRGRFVEDRPEAFKHHYGLE